MNIDTTIFPEQYRFIMDCTWGRHQRQHNNQTFANNRVFFAKHHDLVCKASDIDELEAKIHMEPRDIKYYIDRLELYENEDGYPVAVIHPTISEFVMILERYGWVVCQRPLFDNKKMSFFKYL